MEAAVKNGSDQDCLNQWANSDLRRRYAVQFRLQSCL
jgi:hypothetical protein